MENIDEIATDVFRLSTYNERSGLAFNHFLVRDQEPLLYHTGQKAIFPEVLSLAKKLIDPAALRWIGFSHFEADECGALNAWLAAAPRATPLAGLVLAATCINDFADRPPRVLQDDEVFSTGRHQFRFLSTPHVPHGWGASLLFDETEHTLFCSDLLVQHGKTAPMSDSVVERAIYDLEEGEKGPFRHAIPYTRDTHATFERLAALEPRALAIMHGASFAGDGAGALREFDRALARVVG
jgi:flavorubredoxin